MAFEPQNWAQRLSAAGRSIEQRAASAATAITNNTSNSNVISVDAVNSAVEGATSQFTGATVDLGASLNGLTGQSISDTIGNFARAGAESFISGITGQIPGFGAVSAALGIGFGGKNALPNELDQFASYNYEITLSCLTPFEANYPSLTYRISDPAITILRSSGGDLRGSTISTERNGKTEYFIDNLEIGSLITPTDMTRLTNANRFEFDILEPYSMGNFLEAMQVAAITAGYPNYLEAPYLFIINFKGWDDFGRPLQGGRARRVYPFKFTRAEFSVDEEGSKYRCVGIPYNETALTDQNQSTHTDVQVSGRTVGEMLQSGAKSLTVIMNNRELEKVDAKQNDAANQYVIVFPKTAGSEGAADFAPASQNNGATTKSSSGSQSEGMRQVTDEDLKELYASVAGSENAQIPATFRDEVEKVNGIVLERSQIGEQIRDFADDPENWNDIGSSRLTTSNLDGGKQPMASPASSENEDTPGKIDRCKVQRASDVRTVSISSGKKTQDIIEQIVLASEYARKLISAEPDENGMVPWFRIDTQTYIVPNSGQENRTGEMPKIFVYRVLPYKVHKSAFQSPTEKSPGLANLKKQAVKEYNYIYTGENKDIIDFDIKFRAAFHVAIQGDYGQTSMDSVQGGSQEMAGGNKRTVTGQADGNSEELPQFSQKPSVPKPNNIDLGGLTLFPENIVAMNFNDALVNSPADLMRLDLTIHGDPYFLADSGMGNYSSPGLGNILNVTSEGSMAYESSEVHIRLNFRTPIDYGPDGYMEFPDMGFLPVKQFSGLYKVVKAESNFSAGEFTQVLRLMRVKQQDIDSVNEAVSGPGGALQNVEPEKQVTETPESDKSGSAGGSKNGTGGQSTVSPVDDFAGGNRGGEFNTTDRFGGNDQL